MKAVLAQNIQLVTLCLMRGANPLLTNGLKQNAYELNKLHSDSEAFDEIDGDLKESISVWREELTASAIQMQ